MTKSDILKYISLYEDERAKTKLYAPAGENGSYLTVKTPQLPHTRFIIDIRNNDISGYIAREVITNCHWDDSAEFFTHNKAIKFEELPDIDDFYFTEGISTTSAYLIGIKKVPDIYLNGKPEKDEDGWSIFENEDWNQTTAEIKQKDSTLARLGMMALIDGIEDNTCTGTDANLKAVPEYTTFTGMGPNYMASDFTFIFHRSLEGQVFTLPGLFKKNKALNHYGFMSLAAPFSKMGFKYESTLYLRETWIEIKAQYKKAHTTKVVGMIKELLELSGIEADVKPIWYPLKRAGKPWFLQKKEG